MAKLCQPKLCLLLVVFLNSCFQMVSTAPSEGWFDSIAEAVSSVSDTIYDSTAGVLAGTESILSNARSAILHSTMAGAGIFARVTDEYKKLENYTEEVLDKYHEDCLTSQSVNAVRFYLYANKGNSSEREPLYMDDPASILDSGYNASLQLILLAHGFHESTDGENDSVNIIKRGYFDAGYFATTANIVLIDWSAVACVEFPNQDLFGLYKLMSIYAEAASSVKAVASRVTDFLLFMARESFLSISDGNTTDAHLVGHSLGAHILGLAAQKYTDVSGVKIRRLTGTDPAGPFFHNRPPTERFSPGQAAFVDAVHTNAGEFGILGAVADVDFDVNGGGMFQDCCVDPGLLFRVDRYVSCSHGLATVYFAMSITNRSIEATCSGSCNIQNVTFGEGVSNSATGRYMAKI